MLINAFKNANICFFFITVAIIIINFVIIIIALVVIVSISAGNETRPNKLCSLQLQEQTDGHDQDVNLRSLLKETNSRLFVKVTNTMTTRMPIESYHPPSTPESS